MIRSKDYLPPLPMLCWSSLVVIGCNGSHLPTVATWPGLILMCVDDLCVARESYLPRLVFEGSTWTGSACEECGVWRVIGWDWASVTSQGLRQSRETIFAEKTWVNDLCQGRGHSMILPKATVCYCRGVFFNIISYSSSLCVEASIGRLLVSNFTLLTLPQLCSIMFILFLWLLFLQPKNSSHAASEVVQVLRSSWPLKEP